MTNFFLLKLLNIVNLYYIAVTSKHRYICVFFTKVIMHKRSYKSTHLYNHNNNHKNTIVYYFFPRKTYVFNFQTIISTKIKKNA